jgi:hypothetical protein
MANSYGFNGNIPEDAIAGVYDSLNGEWTGQWFFSEEDARAAEDEILGKEALSIESIEEVNDEEGGARG